MANHIAIKETKNGVYYSELPKSKQTKRSIFGNYYKNCYTIVITDQDILVRDKIENIDYSIPRTSVIGIKDNGKYWEIY